MKRLSTIAGLALGMLFLLVGQANAAGAPAKPQPRVFGSPQAQVAMLYGDLAMTEVDASLNGEYSEDREVACGWNYLRDRGYTPVAWRWGYKYRRAQNEIRRDIEYQVRFLGGDFWGRANLMTTGRDKDYNYSIGGGGSCTSAGEDWTDGWAQWPGWYPA